MCIRDRVTILLQKLRCTQQNDVARGALTAAAAADGQLAYSSMNATAHCWCWVQPAATRPVPNLLTCYCYYCNQQGFYHFGTSRLRGVSQCRPISVETGVVVCDAARDLAVGSESDVLAMESKTPHHKHDASDACSLRFDQ